MKNWAKNIIILASVALALGTLTSLSYTLGAGITIVIKAINYWRGAVALYLLAISLLLLEKK